MLYGHIEEPRHRVDHVLRLRELQDETGGFIVFIPLRFQHDAAGDARNRLQHIPMSTGVEVLRRSRSRDCSSTTSSTSRTSG
jgi:aminodeoxyfutalosine synthase